MLALQFQLAKYSQPWYTHWYVLWLARGLPLNISFHPGMLALPGYLLMSTAVKPYAGSDPTDSRSHQSGHL
jgi:hypothetical protein